MFSAEPFVSISVEDLAEYVQYQLEDMHFVYRDKGVCYHFRATSYNYPVTAVENEIRFIQILNDDGPLRDPSEDYIEMARRSQQTYRSFGTLGSCSLCSPILLLYATDFMLSTCLE